jgi:hypothetical protein
MGRDIAEGLELLELELQYGTAAHEPLVLL